MEDDPSLGQKPYKVKDVSRANCKGVVAASLDEVKAKAADKFGKHDMPNIHLDSDGTEIDDEDYFQTLDPNTELVAVFSGEQWTDPTHYVTITTRRESADMTDSPDVERVHLKKIVGQLKNNLYNVSVLSEPDLEMITNMDPNSVADITGKDFIEQLKEVSGRFLHEKREALDAIELLKMFAKHKGISIDIEHDENDVLTATMSGNVECNGKSHQQNNSLSGNNDAIDSRSTTTTNTGDEYKQAANSSETVIQTQPIAPSPGHDDRTTPNIDGLLPSTPSTALQTAAPDL